MSRCVICCADQMIVGRWYKLVTFPVGVPDRDDGYPAVVDYWAKYSCDAGNVCLLHDTVYIKAEGEFTVSCVDQYGHTASKTITAIAEPTIERTTHEITPTSWADLQDKVSAIGENAYINVTKGEYTFCMTAEYYYLPSGTVIDFSGSTVNITTEVADTEPYKGFRLTGAHCGIKNCTFNGVDIGEGSSYRNRTEAKVYEKCTMIDIYSGDYHKIENLTFNDVAGFNIGLGTWPAYWYNSPNATASRWRATNSCSGYISDTGEVVESADAWTMSDYVEAIQTEDRSYCVGHSGMWLPTSVRVYDIAFYDVGGNLLELKKDQQYFRKYYYPEGTVYVRYCIHQSNEPEEHTGRDDYCVMRMMAGNERVSVCPTVKECVIDNIVHNNHCSGGFSGVGLCEDVHINRMLAPGSGWLNGWAFDIEDSWNAALGYVISHSYFGNGTVYTHGAQGVSFVSTVGGNLMLVNNVHFPSAINSLFTNCTVNGVRGCMTAANSYTGTVTDGEGFGNAHSFGEIEKAEALDMRTRLNYAF